MAFDAQKFLTDIGLPVEDQTTVLALFDKHPDVSTKIEAQFTSLSSSADALKTELEAQKAKLDAEWETLAGIRSGDSKQIEATEKRIEEMAAKNAVLESRLRKVVTEAGGDADAVLKDLVVKAPEKKVETTMTGLTREEVIGLSGTNAWNALTNAAVLQDIATEHLELFGKPLKNSADLLIKLRDEVKRTGDQNLTLRDLWAKEHKVEDRRNEIREADIKRRETDAFERGKREATDAAALRVTPLQPTTFEGSPVLAALAAHDTKDGKVVAPVIRGVPDGVSAAILAFRKLRQAS